MNALHAVLAAIAAHGPAVLLGVTVVLACGATCVWFQRAPAQRRRLGLLTAAGALVYLAAAVAPLPRLSGRELVVASEAAVAESAAAAARRTAQLQAAIAQLTQSPAPLDADVAPVVLPHVATAPAAAPDRPSPPAGVAVPWALLAAALYVAGVVVVLLRRLVGWRYLRTVLAAARPLPAELAHGLDVPDRVRLLVARHPVRPFCTGLWRCVVVLPPSLLEPGRAAEARAVLRHELAHVRAGDPGVWALLAWLAVPLWCHPLVLWLGRDVRFCSELLADDAAAAAEGRQHYARALIDLAERSGHELAAAGTVAVFQRPSEFYRRIQMLLSRQSPLCTSTSRLRRAVQSLSMLGLVTAVAGTFGVPAAGQEPAAPLQRENAELRATVDLLRTELAQLRDQIAALRQASDSHDASLPTDVTRRLIDHMKSLAAEGGGGAPAGAGGVALGKDGVVVDADLLNRLTTTSQRLVAVNGRTVASKGDALKVMRDLHAAGERTFTTRWLVDGREEERVYVCPPEDPTAGTPRPDPASPADPAAKVPVLGDLPLLGNLFRTEATPTPGDAGAALPQPTRVRMGRVDERGNFTPSLRDYTVREGDSLQRIAQRELGDERLVDEIVACNEGLDPSRLRPGQVLRLPVVTDHDVVMRDAVDTPPAAAGMPAVAEDRVAELLRTQGFGHAGEPVADAGAATVAALADLTSRYLDLQAELEVARVTAEEAKALAAAGQMPQRDALRSAVAVRTLEKKLAIASRLIDGELAATESELRWLARRRDEASPTERLQLEMQTRRATTRLQAMQSVR